MVLFFDRQTGGAESNNGWEFSGYLHCTSRRDCLQYLRFSNGTRKSINSTVETNANSRIQSCSWDVGLLRNFLCHPEFS